LEFSFDRSNDSHLRNTTQAKTEVKPEPAAAAPAESYDDGIDTSTIQNERLKKAIERNRARQAERARLRPEPVQAAPAAQPVREAQPAYQPAYQSAYQQHYQATQSTPSPVETHVEPTPEPVQEQASLFGSRQSSQVEEPVAEPAASERPRTRMRMRAGASRGETKIETAAVSASEASAAPTSAMVTRRTVARPDETDFTPTKRAPRKVTSQISYSTNGSKKKAKPLDPTLVTYLVKGCWIFCGIMILRLIFANGGVTDYYSRKSILNDRLGELDRIKKENMQLVREIERMQSDTSFQKKLVRDNLGFIAEDEFLILFPKEKSVQ